MIVQRQNSAYDRTDSTASGCQFKRATSARFFLFIFSEERDCVQRRENRFFAAMPSFFSILACVMFVGILLVLIVGERWLEPFYENKSLIKNGVLAGRLHNAMSAAALDEGLTGNARAINCSFEPIVRMTTTYIEGGDHTFDELIAPIEKGYFIKTINHGSGMSTFTIAPSVAYEIKNGKLVKPVQISVITGSVFETLGLIDGLTKDVELLSFVTGGCGKMEQLGLPVGFGGPFVRISAMNVQ